MAEASRRQFSLVLAWATTIHKVQGLTPQRIVVNMKGNVSNVGQYYVAFRYVKTLAALFVKNFNPASTRVSTSVMAGMDRLSTHCLCSEPVPQVLALLP